MPPFFYMVLAELSGVWESHKEFTCIKFEYNWEMIFKFLYWRTNDLIPVRNYCNNLYITYIVLKLGESTGMLISVRMLPATIASYYLPFWSLCTVYDIELLLHHGELKLRANCMKWEIVQTNSSCIVCVTLLDCWTEGYIHRFFKREVLFCNVTK